MQFMTNAMILILTLLISRFWMATFIVSLLMVFTFFNLFGLQECLTLCLISTLVTKLWLQNFSDRRIGIINFGKLLVSFIVDTTNVSKYDTGLNTLLLQCQSELSLDKNVGKPEFSDRVNKIIVCNKRNRCYKTVCLLSDWPLCLLFLFAHRWVRIQILWWSRLKDYSFRWSGLLFYSVSRPTGVLLVVFFCAVFHWCCWRPQRSPSLNTLFLLSPHLCFVIGFICDLSIGRNNS